jgi:hypothetical protein
MKDAQSGDIATVSVHLVVEITTCVWYLIEVRMRKQK